MLQVIPGELLPWKGEWFEVVNVEDKIVTIRQRDKRTAGAEKRDKAREKWLRNHPKAKEIR
jgi:hypothetical protein